MCFLLWNIAIDVLLGATQFLLKRSVQWAKNIQNPDFIALLYVLIFIEKKYGPKIYKTLTFFVFCVGA
jgi:hypothetical protein